jgi:hypothetical protein
MIFAICGLTVLGTGTERAGTFSIGASAVWARAVEEAIIAAHKIIATRRCTFEIRTASLGFLIACSPAVCYECLCWRFYIAVQTPSTSTATPSVGHYSRTRPSANYRSFHSVARHAPGVEPI